MNDHLSDTICYAIAIGALKSIADDQPSLNSKRGGGCMRLVEKIEREGYKLLPINEYEVKMLSSCIEVSAKFMDTLDNDRANHILLNLACFCMEDIKHILRRPYFDHINRLFEIFAESDCHSDILLGRRVYERLMAEVTIEKAQREI